MNSPSSGSFDGLPFASAGAFTGTGQGASFMPAVNAGDNTELVEPGSAEPGSPYRRGDASPGKSSQKSPKSPQSPVRASLLQSPSGPMSIASKENADLQGKINNMSNGFDFESSLSEDHPISDI